jgi:hypothetical protein
MRFEVQPQALAEQAPLIGRQGGRLAELAGEVRGLAGVAGATGSPEAAAAVERFVRIWSESVLLMAGTVDALGAATGSAAAAYTATDAGAIPAGGGGW